MTEEIIEKDDENQDSLGKKIIHSPKIIKSD